MTVTGVKVCLSRKYFLGALYCRHVERRPAIIVRQAQACEDERHAIATRDRLQIRLVHCLSSQCDTFCTCAYEKDSMDPKPCADLSRSVCMHLLADETHVHVLAACEKYLLALSTQRGRLPDPSDPACRDSGAISLNLACKSLFLQKPWQPANRGDISRPPRKCHLPSANAPSLLPPLKRRNLESIQHRTRHG
jgi:hypothetical protein